MVAVFLLLSIPLLTGSTLISKHKEMCWLSVKFVKATKVICFIYIIMLSEETIICFQVFIPTFSQGFCCSLVNRAGMGGSTGACIVKTVRMYRIRMYCLKVFSALTIIPKVVHSSQATWQVHWPWNTVFISLNFILTNLEATWRQRRAFFFFSSSSYAPLL